MSEQDVTTVHPTITSEVVTNVTLPRESQGQGKDVTGSEVRIFANGRLVGTVEVPGRPEHWPLELVGTSVDVGASWSDYESRCRFPSGGAHRRTADEVAAIEKAHTLRADVRARLAT